MPENQIPATQPESGAAAGEFNFAKAEAESPRIRRRSLRTKPGGLLKPGGAPSASRELEREAPPLAAEPAAKPPGSVDLRATVERDPLTGGQPKLKQTPENSTSEVRTKPGVSASAPPKVLPSVAATPSPAPASASPSPGQTTVTTNSTSGPASSPHGTRPATLYYSSNSRKAETPSPMKTIPTAGPAPSNPATSATPVARAAAASSRPAPTVDYRANVERQSREQKSVGNILTYVVYALIGFFVLSAGLAGYGADVIFQRLHDQSQTVTDLDARYAAANKDLNAKLATTQDTLAAAQAQIARQQDLIVKQQDELNRLIAATNDVESAIRQEKQARAQETASLRERVRELEYKTSIQKY
jgi:hypothetical protein